MPPAPRPPLGRLRPLALPATVTAGAVLPLLAVLASGRTLEWRDTARLFAPMRPLVEEALRGLSLPLWNPHEALGVPLFAQLIHGVLHPVSVAAAFLAPGAPVDLLVVVHVCLAALGAALLARTLGVSRGGAAAAGFAYGLSGYVLGMTGILTYLAASATAPFAVAALRAAGERGGRAGWAALAVAALHLAGDPQWTVAAVLLGGALALEAAGAGGLLRAVLATGLGTALAAVQLVPAWTFLAETERAGGLAPVDRAMWALAPARLVELVAPGLFGGVGTAESAAFAWLGASGGPQRIPFAPGVFVGAAALALALAGARRRRAGGLLVAAALLFLWLALGRHAGAEQALGWIPIWRSFRFAEKLAGPATLCLALLAGLGADRLAARPDRAARLAAGAGALVAAAAALLALAPVIEPLAASETGRAAAPVVRASLAVGLAHAAAGLLGLAGALALGRTRVGARVPLPAAAAAVVLASSWAAAPFALHAGPAGARERAPLARVARGAALRVATPLELAPLLVPGHAAALDDMDALTAAKSRMAEPAYNVAGRLDQLGTYTGLRPRRLLEVEAALGPLRWTAYRRFALTHVVLQEPRPGREEEIARAAVAGGRLVHRDPDWPFDVFEVPHRPWASFAAEVVFAASDAAAVAALVEAARAGDAGRVVLQASFDARGGAGRVIAAARGVDSVRVEAEGEGLLVLADACWPGWEATLDGRPVPIGRADVLARAVEWPPGRHVLEMAYRPPELRAGLAVTGGAVVILAAVLAAAAVRRRRASAAAHRSPAATV